jgi:hypothetical protein
MDFCAKLSSGVPKHSLRSGYHAIKKMIEEAMEERDVPQRYVEVLQEIV